MVGNDKRIKLDELSLEGKVSLITGGTSGIGLAIAQAFALHHSQVIICGTSQPKAGRALKKVPQAKFYACDTGIHQQVKDTCMQVMDKWGKVDILVINAATEFNEEIKEIKIENWHRVMEVNLSGAFYFIKYLIGPMMEQKKGNIIVISSVASITGSGGGMHYSASKAGLKGIVNRINYELLPQGIRANLISPGVIDTPMLRKKYPDEPQTNARLSSQVPLGRIGKPKDIANLALFLASDMSAYICGADIIVDGGRTFYRRPPGSYIGSRDTQ